MQKFYYVFTYKCVQSFVFQTLERFPSNKVLHGAKAAVEAQTERKRGLTALAAAEALRERMRALTALAVAEAYPRNSSSQDMIFSNIKIGRGLRGSGHGNKKYSSYSHSTKSHKQQVGCIRAHTTIRIMKSGTSLSV